MDRAAAATGEVTGGLGVFGGTFDPIHLGHLIVADEVCALLGLQRVLFVPAQVSPLKTVSSAWFTTEERVAMVRLAIADNPRFALSCVDAQRDGPSFSYQTLRLLREQLEPQAQLHFIMGLDSLEHFHRWRQPQDILRLARLAVVSRPGSRPDWPSLEARLPGIRAATDLIETLQVGISSTEIRRRLQTGQPVRYQLPPAVYSYIAEHPRPLGAAGG
jgi:nicotinate-nucleotide adenylyltransferase